MKLTFDDPVVTYGPQTRTNVQVAQPVTDGDKYEDYYSMFTRTDEHRARGHIIGVKRWNPVSKVYDRGILNLSDSSITQGASNMDGIDITSQDAVTNDKMVKAILRQNDDYKSKLIQEWRLVKNKNGSNGLERIFVNHATGAVQILDKMVNTEGGQRVTQESMDQMVQRRIDAMSDHQLAEQVKRRKVGQGTVVEINN